MAVMNAKQYAEHRGVSGVAVHKWISEGKLGQLGEAVQKSGRQYLIDSEKADMFLELNQKVTMQQPGLPLPDPAGPADGGPGKKENKSRYNAARTLDAEYAALLRKHEYQIETGVYVLAAEVQLAAYNLARTTRDAVLNVPDRVAPILAAEMDPRKVAELLTTELQQALEELTA